MKKALFDYVRSAYGVSPEYLWEGFPDIAVLRRSDNRKWFAVIMTVPRSKLHLEGDEPTDIVNVRAPDPVVTDLLADQKGYCRAYHMNKRLWLSVLLDGTVPFEEICACVDASYNAVGRGKGKIKERTGEN